MTNFCRVCWGTLWIYLMVFSLPQCGCCENPKGSVTLGEVVVEERQEKRIMEVKTTQPNTETTINKEGIRIFGGAGQISPFKAVEILPSTNFQSADAYGLTNNQSIRVRGQTRVASTIEGLSLMNYGLNPGPSDQWLFDMENLANISLYRGAVNVEKSFSPYNTGGSVDRTILRPRDTLGLTFGESYGSYDFNKVFVRFDSGLFPTGTKLFASYSNTQADKWKGEGDFDAEIFSFGIVQNFSPNVRIELFGTHSEPETYAYRSLTYSQARDLSTYKKHDYNRELTGIGAKDVYYYDYNRDTFKSDAYFSNIEIKIPGNGKVTLQPYFIKERGHSLAGTRFKGGPAVQRWDIIHENYGLSARYDVSLMGTDVALGYWYANQEPPGPPTARKMYRAVGKTLVYAGWAMLADPVDHHQWHTPFVTVGRQAGPFYVKGGLRYVYEKFPSLDFYDATGIPNVSYRRALRYAAKDPAGCVSSRTLDEWLPNVGVNYEVSKRLNAYFDYGRNFGRPAFDVWNAYGNNKPVFDARGVPAQYLWDNIKAEISDHFDLGMRYDADRWNISGTLFYALHNDKGVSVADPYLGGIKYTQNIADATSYGAELEVTMHLADQWDIFATASYNKFEFDDDIKTSPTAVTRAEGNQVPDVPKLQARFGATYRIGGFSLSPIVRYTGKRYGDVENRDRVSPHTVVDADMRYTKENIWGFKSLSAGISLYNLFDTDYISVISVSDDTRQGSASYYAAAPFTAVGRIELRF